MALRGIRATATPIPRTPPASRERQTDSEGDGRRRRRWTTARDVARGCCDTRAPRNHNAVCFGVGLPPWSATEGGILIIPWWSPWRPSLPAGPAGGRPPRPRPVVKSLLIPQATQRGRQYVVRWLMPRNRAWSPPLSPPSGVLRGRARTCPLVSEVSGDPTLLCSCGPPCMRTRRRVSGGRACDRTACG